VKSDARATFTLSSAVADPPSSSVSVAVFSSLCGSATDGATVPVRVTAAGPQPAAIVPRWQVSAVGVDVQVGTPGVTDAGTNPVGMGSVRTMPVASLGPLFVTVSV
jgi:hypothetical protein